MSPFKLSVFLPIFIFSTILSSANCFANWSQAPQCNFVDIAVGRFQAEATLDCGHRIGALGYPLYQLGQPIYGSSGMFWHLDINQWVQAYQCMGCGSPNPRPDIQPYPPHRLSERNPGGKDFATPIILVPKTR
jgi:hypothetical protein